MPHFDTIQRFLIESTHIRGEIVHLENTLVRAFARHHYSLAQQQLLGETMAASVLLSATVKFDGQLSLQLQGNTEAPLQLLYAQCDNHFNVRGILRAREASDITDLRKLSGNGTFAITIQSSHSTQPYQSLVALQDASLAKCLENYFQQSEQLATYFYLCSDGTRAAGLLLQALPEQERDADDWTRITTLADTLTAKELLDLNAETIVMRLYHEEIVRLYELDLVRFCCTCSHEKMVAGIQLLGSAEAHAILAEEGVIQIICDFCQQHYTFDKVIIKQIFGENVIPFHDKIKTTD